jgi:hypothetical protein
MTSDLTLQRLFDIVKKDSVLIEQNLITVDDGVYHVFNRFQIRSMSDSRYQVSRGDHAQAVFSTLSAALSWCIAEKLQNYTLSRNIQQLDQQCARLSDDLDLREKLMSRSKDNAYRDIVSSKTMNKKQALKLARNQLQKCVAVAKYFQTKGFNDEIARTRRIAQDTTAGLYVRKPNRTKAQF